MGGEIGTIVLICVRKNSNKPYTQHTGPHNGGSPPCDHSFLRWSVFGDSFWYVVCILVENITHSNNTRTQVRRCNGFESVERIQSLLPTRFYRSRLRTRGLFQRNTFARFLYSIDLQKNNGNERDQHHGKYRERFGNTFVCKL